MTRPPTANLNNNTLTRTITLNFCLSHCLDGVVRSGLLSTSRMKDVYKCTKDTAHARLWGEENEF
jgi:hypothetical protein